MSLDELVDLDQIAAAPCDPSDWEDVANAYSLLADALPRAANNNPATQINALVSAINRNAEKTQHNIDVLSQKQAELSKSVEDLKTTNDPIKSIEDTLKRLIKDALSEVEATQKEHTEMLKAMKAEQKLLLVKTANTVASLNTPIVYPEVADVDLGTLELPKLKSDALGITGTKAGDYLAKVGVPVPPNATANERKDMFLKYLGILL